MWAIFSFASAFLETAKDFVGKKGSERTNEYVTAFSLQFFAALILTPLVFMVGIPIVRTPFYYAVAGFILLLPLATILYMRAIKLSPLSVSIPMLAFNPMFTAINGIFFDRRFPSIHGWIGIGLVCIGFYMLRLSKKIVRKGFLYPLFSLRNETGALSMLSVSFLWSITAHLNALAVRSASPLLTAWSITVVTSVILFLVAKRKTILTFTVIKRHWQYLFSLGMLNACSEIALSTALRSGMTPYVISIKRTNILWSSLVGKFFLKEAFGVMKFFGLCAMMAGVALILIFR